MAGQDNARLRLFSGEMPTGSDASAEPDDRLFHREAFRKPPRGLDLEPFSPEWFERIGCYRYARQGYWLPRTLEFTKHAGESLLAMGEGLGTDWIQYARNGADVNILSPSQEQLALMRLHFELTGQTARFVHGSTQSVPLPNDSVDVACIQGLLHEVDDPARMVSEVYRVLRPGGKVIAVVPAQFNAAYWSDAVFPWRKWLRMNKGDRNAWALSARSLHEAFAAFAEHRISKRHLRRGELPPIWRWIPLSVLERAIGNLLVIKAFKPLSAAVAVRHAA